MLRAPKNVSAIARAVFIQDGSLNANIAVTDLPGKNRCEMAALIRPNANDDGPAGTLPAKPAAALNGLGNGSIAPV